MTPRRPDATLEVPNDCDRGRAAWQLPLLVPLAHTLVALPFVIRSLLPVLRGLTPHLREAAAVQGASPRRVWREVDLPMLAPALIYIAIMVPGIVIGISTLIAFVSFSNASSK